MRVASGAQSPMQVGGMRGARSACDGEDQAGATPMLEPAEGLSPAASDRAVAAAAARVAALSAIASAEEAKQEATDADLRALREFSADDSPDLARIPTRAMHEIWGQARLSTHAAASPSF
jgi:hypothetical protein